MSKNIFFIAVILMTFASGLVLMFLIQAPEREEAEAETEICRSMAEDVLAEEASRFDYMATRCPALFLTGTEEN